MICHTPHVYTASKTESGYFCTLPPHHAPAEQHEDTALGRRWTEPTRTVPNRADRRARLRSIRRAIRKGVRP